MNRIYTITLILITFFLACKKEETEVIDCTNSNPSYANDVKSIINANCLSSGCHNSGSNNGDYTTYNGLKAAASSGALQNRVIDNKTMPPSQPLSLEDRKKIQCWIKAGAQNN